MRGRVVHRWAYPTGDDSVWDHAVLVEDGSLLVINKFAELLLLDRHSRLRWRRPLQVHHDVAVAPDRTIFAVTREIRQHRGLSVRFDNLEQLGPEGEPISNWSSYRNLGELKRTLDTRSFLDGEIDRLGARQATDPAAGSKSGESAEAEEKLYDYFHLNTVSLLPNTELGEKDRRFREGNLLLCFRNVNQLAILDQDSWQIVWSWGEGSLEWPHHPTMTPQGTILVFDNGLFRKHSRVLEIDPVSRETIWQYAADPPEEFFSPKKGSAQRLPNGNTLICEGDRGRTFEVTPDGGVVWEWLNPRVEQGHRETIYRMIRYRPETVRKALRKATLKPR
jgi:hypothetical protein